jgi:hypothetical protein
MSHLYPTVYYHKASFGLPAYEVRGNQIYPTVHNQWDAYGLPTYETLSIGVHWVITWVCVVDFIIQHATIVDNVPSK